MDEKTVARFWAKVDKVNGPVHPLYGRCWVWAAYRRRDGYGQFRFGPTTVGAHRLSWILHLGKIDGDTAVICHRCDNPPCVNPAHLFIGTRADNNADMHAKGRAVHPRGERHGNAKLSDADVRLIRAYRGQTQRQLAAKFGVRQATIWQILHGNHWRHVGSRGDDHATSALVDRPNPEESVRSAGDGGDQI